MFKKQLNRAVVRLRLETASPLLIVAGEATGLDPAASDMSCVRTSHGRFGRTVYIPGSSFKGVLRSTAEAFVRGNGYQGLGHHLVDGACTVFPSDKGSCGHKYGDRKETDTAKLHAQHCLACRLFGSTGIKGRASVRDLFPFPAGLDELGDFEDNFKAANNTEVRYGVAIDRMLGSVAVGPFDSEMVPVGVRFWGDIALENYQAWQLGLIASAIQDLDDGFAQLGHSKTRGFGMVKVDVESIVHMQVLSGPDKPAGVGDLVPRAEAERYGLLPESPLPQAQGRVYGLFRRFEVTGDEAHAWLEQTMGCLPELGGR